MSISPEEIRAIRKGLGLSQVELADRLHLTRDAVASWEIGRSHPSGPAEILLRQLASIGATPKTA